MRSLAILPVVMAASCTFPSVTFTDASTARDAALEAASDQDSGTGDAGAQETGTSCDQDNDGYHADSGTCGGDDCNDLDPNVHPNQTWVYLVPDASSHFGDWDCDGIVELEYQTITSCATSCGAQGFTQPIGCGVSGPFITCVGTIVCTIADGGTQTQGCK